MTAAKAQSFLFQRIRELLPPDVSMVDAVAEILHLSADSAYRRIRGETPMVLDEASELCTHFKLSLDRILQVQSGSVLFQNVQIRQEDYTYTRYLKDLGQQLQFINNHVDKEIIYLTKDVPLFHNFYFQPLIAFRYFFWMKTIQGQSEFATRGFGFDCLTPEVESMSVDLVKAYTQIPSVEIWNTECINSAISQVEFYKDSGLFSSAADIMAVYESLEEMLMHLKAQVELGCKFMPGENPDSKKENFRFFYNRVLLADNTIFVTTDGVHTVYFNYDVLNYMYTRDDGFCTSRLLDLQNMMRKATVISRTSEKQRNIFFGILLAKILERKRYL